ncbi:MAG: hypothetical protein WAN65_24720 [Candidatus Sulfotelmatobacter sp.]
MSVRNGFVLLLALSALTFLVACGGSSSGITIGVPPPTGGFTNANLTGTYVFAVSGIDFQGDPVSMVGTFTADGSGGNGKGGITGGTIDINDAAATPVANAQINTNSFYSIGKDGRGQATIGVPANPINGDNIVFDFVLQNSSHGLITGFNGDYTGSGTIDLQSSPAASGSYAFILSGFDASNAFASVGNFTLGSGGAITSGLADFNDGGFPYAESLSGGVVLGPSATPGTTLITLQFGTQTYDVYGIDSTHLKFIEMDPGVTLAGDAYSQSSTSMPVGTLPFTISGSYPGPSTFSVAGGFIVTDASGDITSASTEDANNGGTVSPSPITFSGNYVAAGTGRFTLALSGFSDGLEYAAYPSSAGVLLLEIDTATSSIMSGVAYPPQSSTAFSTSAGYALNLTGANLTNGVEVDDIAEFAADSTGTTVTGVIDENYQPNSTGTPIFGVALTGTYTAPDSNGRGQIVATAANGSNSTINGGLGLTFYTVDGTTFPFIETDANGQVTSGVFVQQSTTAGAAVAKPHNMFVPHPLIRPHAKQKQEAK